ncbi:MAG: lactate utilization protein [Clostridia bacterium]|nr:lactate utilization protein [Clostridia bacterium]MBQ8566448.1 lactate utilization protein [Clostridia bacterium]
MDKIFSSLMEELKKRQFKPYYAENKEEAVRTVLSVIDEEMAKKGKTEKEMQISFGGSRTLSEIDVYSAIEKYNVLDPYAFPTRQEQHEAKRRALLSDVFLMSANALCESGEIVNIDGNGNRLGAMICGPDKVVMVVGKNKIVKDKASAMERIKTIACVKNAQRLSRKTPCAEKGKCESCLISGQTICGHTVYTRYSSIPERIVVILVNEELGF